MSKEIPAAILAGAVALSVSSDTNSETAQLDTVCPTGYEAVDPIILSPEINPAVIGKDIVVFPDEDGNENPYVIDRKVVIDPETGLAAVCEMNQDTFEEYIESLDIKA